jgi:phosphoribosylformimino-5-aminoimidazole carboxamide ribotide isomerase
MDIIPAIDLKNGQCVRLAQGDFAKTTVYHTDPVAQACAFADAGAQWLHVVDLDGAKAGTVQQADIIAAIARKASLNVQVGGGIRDEQTIKRLFDAGIKRVVIGSVAVDNPDLVKTWLREFGTERMVLAFDIRMTADAMPELLTQGWQSGSQKSLWDILNIYTGSGLKTILCTDVGRDGMLGGANHALYTKLHKDWPKLEVLASGGVSGLADLMKLANLGVTGAVVGKAIYEGRVDLNAALRQVQHAG